MMATMTSRRPFRVVLVSAAVTAPLLAACSDTTARDNELDPEEELDQAIEELVAMPGGPPSAIVVVQRGSDRSVHTAGVAELGTDEPPEVEDHMRIASVAKAFSGATVLSLVDEGVMSLDDTIAQRLPELSEAWGEVTLRQLLSHTSGAARLHPGRAVRRCGARIARRGSAAGRTGGLRRR